MNRTQIDKTLSRLAKNNITLDETSHISDLDIADISQIMKEANDTDIDGTNLTRFVIIRVAADSSITPIENDNEYISNKDIKTISSWFKEEIHDTYSEDFFRVDLEKYIMIFKVHNNSDGKIIVGHLLNNTYDVKVQLIGSRQTYLTRDFI